MKKPKSFENRRKGFIHSFEKRVIDECEISEKNFHKVRGDQWQEIYQIITEKFANKTKVWKTDCIGLTQTDTAPK